MNVDLSFLDQLVHEYCIYRGFVGGGSHVCAGKCLNLYCYMRILMFEIGNILCLLDVFF
jgi:hypothetical protein